MKTKMQVFDGLKYNTNRMQTMKKALMAFKKYNFS